METCCLIESVGLVGEIAGAGIGVGLVVGLLETDNCESFFGSLLVCWTGLGEGREVVLSLEF